MFQTNQVTAFLVLRRHHSDVVSTTLPSIHRHSSFQNCETRQTRSSQRHTTGKHIAINLSFQWPLPHFATIWVRFFARFFGVKTHRNAEKPWSNRSNRLRQGTHNRRRSEIQVVNLASRRSEPWIFQSIQSIHIYPTYPNSNLPISKVSGDMPDKTMKHLRPKSSMSKIKNFASVGNHGGIGHVPYRIYRFSKGMTIFKHWGNHWNHPMFLALLGLTIGESSMQKPSSWFIQLPGRPWSYPSKWCPQKTPWT